MAPRNTKARSAGTNERGAGTAMLRYERSALANGRSLATRFSCADCTTSYRDFVVSRTSSELSLLDEMLPLAEAPAFGQVSFDVRDALSDSVSENVSSFGADPVPGAECVTVTRSPSATRSGCARWPPEKATKVLACRSSSTAASPLGPSIVVSRPDENAASTRSEAMRAAPLPSASSALNAAKPDGPTATSILLAIGARSGPPASVTPATVPCNSVTRGIAGPFATTYSSARSSYFALASFLTVFLSVELRPTRLFGAAIGSSSRRVFSDEVRCVESVRPTGSGASQPSQRARS